MNLKLQVLETNIPWNVLQEFNISVGNVKIPEQSAHSVDFYAQEGRIATCDFIPSDDLYNLLINYRQNYMHIINSELTYFYCELSDEVTNEVMFKGMALYSFEFDDYKFMVKGFSIADSVYILIKYWLDWVEATQLIVPPSEGDTAPALTTSFSNALDLAIQSESFSERVGPFIIQNTYQTEIEFNGVLVSNYELLNLGSVFFGLTNDKFFEEISETQYSYLVRKTNLYRANITVSEFDLIACHYYYNYYLAWTPDGADPVYLEKIYIKRYRIESTGQYFLLDNIFVRRNLSPTIDFGHLPYPELYKGIYEELESTGTRLYDTEYLAQGYLEQKDPFIFSHAGDNYAIVPGLSENGAYWQIYLNGTIFFDEIELNGDITPSELLKGLVLINNLGIYSSLAGNIIIANRIKTYGNPNQIYLDFNDIRSEYVEGIPSKYTDDALNVFFNKDAIAEIIKDYYNSLDKKYKVKRNIITDETNIFINDEIIIDGKTYKVYAKDNFSLYPFVKYKTYGEV